MAGKSQDRFAKAVHRVQFYQEQADKFTARVNEELVADGFPPIDNRQLALTSDDLSLYLYSIEMKQKEVN